MPLALLSLVVSQLYAKFSVIWFQFSRELSCHSQSLLWHALHSKYYRPVNIMHRYRFNIDNTQSCWVSGLSDTSRLLHHLWLVISILYWQDFGLMKLFLYEIGCLLELYLNLVRRFFWDYFVSWELAVGFEPLRWERGGVTQYLILIVIFNNLVVNI